MNNWKIDKHEKWTHENGKTGKHLENIHTWNMEDGKNEQIKQVEQVLMFLQRSRTNNQKIENVSKKAGFLVKQFKYVSNKSKK